MAFLVGAFGSYLQCSMTALSFKYGEKAISIFNGGFSLSGICTTAIAILDLSFLSDSTVFEQVVYYELFQIFATASVAMISIFYFRTYPEDKYFSSLESEAEQGNQDYIVEPSIWSTFNLIYPVVLTMFFNFTITMSFCPVMLFTMGTGWKNESMAQQVILMVFNVCDFLGKLLYTRVTLEGTMRNHLLSLSKVLFVVLPCLSSGSLRVHQLENVAWLTLTASALFGWLNGYLNCSLFHIASLRVKPRHRNNAAYLCVVSLMLGFLYGSLCNLFGLRD